MLLLLDVSGSMNGKTSGGGTKFAAAKKALKKVADAMPGRHPGGVAGLRLGDLRGSDRQPEGVPGHQAGGADL